GSPASASPGCIAACMSRGGWLHATPVRCRSSCADLCGPGGPDCEDAEASPVPGLPYWRSAVDADADAEKRVTPDNTSAGHDLEQAPRQRHAALGRLYDWARRTDDWRLAECLDLETRTHKSVSQVPCVERRQMDGRVEPLL